MNTPTAVVVTYNSAGTIAACIESLLRHGITNIVVVDNASQDDTVAIARGYPVRVIAQSRNGGFAQAANVGAAQYQADYLLFFNPDAVLTDSLAPAVHLLSTHQSTGIIGLGLYDTDGRLEPDSFGQEPDLRTLVTRKTVSAERKRTDWVSGGGMLIRTSLFRQLKGFDEQFFLYWEDVDMCRRARDAGHTVAHLPNIRVKHQRGASLKDRIRKARLYDRSADRYFQKHYAAPIWLIQHSLRRIYRLAQPQSR